MMQKLPYTKWLLYAGLLPLPWFLFWVTIAGFQSPGYNPISQHASELTQKPGLAHTLINITALGCGIGFCLFAIGLGRLTERRLSIGALAWIIFGVSMASNGIWPMGGPLHGLYSVGIINLIAPALSLVELMKNATNTQWREHHGMYVITVLVSVAGVVYLWMNLTGSDPQSYRGMTQRVFSSINSLWPAYTAWIYAKASRPTPKPL
jgi:hypothetical protein